MKLLSCLQSTTPYFLSRKLTLHAISPTSTRTPVPEHVILLCIGVTKTIFDSLCLNLLISHERHLFSRADIGDILKVALGKDEINLFKGAVSSLRVEEIDNR